MSDKTKLLIVTDYLVNHLYYQSKMKCLEKFLTCYDRFDQFLHKISIKEYFEKVLFYSILIGTQSENYTKQMKIK